MADAASSRNVAMAVAAWGDPAPDWIVVLAEACDAASQAQVARRLGISGSCVNQVLKRGYRGRLDRVEAKTRGLLMGRTVDCPALLTALPLNECLANQAKPYDGSNHLTVRLSRTCPSCPHRTRRKEEGADVAQ